MTKSAGFTLLVLLALVPVTALAEIYQWVDESGKVRFSDKPPAGQETAAVMTSEPSSERQSTGRALMAGASPRPLGLETIQYQIADDEQDKEIGKRYYSGFGSSAGCSSNPQLLDTNYALGLLRSGKVGYTRTFHNLLKDNGYKVADGGDSVFANQRAQAAELSVAALVKKAYFEHCDLRGSNRESFNKTNLTIEWQLFDNLKREIIFSQVTEGSDNSWGTKKPEGHLASFDAAMRKAAIELLSFQEFADAVSDTTALAEMNPAGMKDVVYRYGNRQKTFVDQTAAIERGTVTIRTPGGHGSGFVITSNGHVLTNEHVVAGSNRVVVVTTVGETFGQVLHRDAERDIALVKIDALFANSPLSVSRKQARVGEQIYAVGTPLSEELSFSVTRGIISGRRELRGMPLYQTDAAINPGNSGGPVLNEFGNVVAIAVSGIFTQSGGSLNTNFLIPIDDALKKLGIYLPPG